MSGTAKGIFAVIAVLLFFVAVFLFGFFDTVSEFIHDDEVEVLYNAQITDMSENPKVVHILFRETQVYITTYSVVYSDGTRETFDIESPVPQKRNHSIGEKITVFRCGDRHSFDRSELFAHPTLHRIGIGIIILEVVVIMVFIAPKQRRMFGY